MPEPMNEVQMPSNKLAVGLDLRDVPKFGMTGGNCELIHRLNLIPIG